MFKHLTLLTLCLIALITTPTAAQVIEQHTAAPNTADTVTDLAMRTRIINQRFDDIYLQNARVATFGNEYGNKPLPTQLVADLTGNFVLFSTPKSRFSFIFNPRVKLRLLSTQGAPVKSPSYMPGGTLYMRLNRDDYNPQFLSAAYSHHSNGVRGPTLNADGSFNRDSGKFTTNFYTLTYTHGHRVDRGNIISNRYESLGVELHAGLINQGVSEALKGNYGFVRVNGQWMYNLSRSHPDAIDPKLTTFANWLRLQVDLMYIMDKYASYGFTDFKKRMNVSAVGYYQFPFMQNVALMLGGGYRGQDDYNIFFQDSYAYVTVGVAAGVSFGFHHK